MKLTIDKFQRLQGLSILEESEQDKSSRIIQILLDKTPEQVDNMPEKKFNKLCATIKHLFELEVENAITSKPQKLIKANGIWYKLNFEIKRPFNTGRYIEVLTFSKGNPIEDMHNILASICTPTKWSWKKFRLVDQPYDALSHEKYADDFKQADFKHGYHAMVFFCILLTNLTSNTRAYSAQEIMRIMSNQKRLRVLKRNFKKILDGFTTHLK
jgi:hypothetical protein